MPATPGSGPGAGWPGGPDDNSGDRNAGTLRLSNLDKLSRVPVFALRGLIEKHAPGCILDGLSQDKLIARAGRLSTLSEAEVEDLYENYRYGRKLAFHLYLLPSGLEEPDREAFQKTLDESAAQDPIDLDMEILPGEDYEGESSPGRILLLDEEQLDGIREIRFRYYVARQFLDVDEHPNQVFQSRYGFLWIDLNLGYLAILSRDESINGKLVQALSRCIQALPLPVRFTEELVDKHFSIEKIKRVSHYDPGTGVRQSISGQELWQKFEHEIVARERQYIRPSSLYDEEIAAGVISGLGVVSTKGKIYFTRALPTSLVRAWGLQRLPELVRDAKELQQEHPEHFRSMEAINHMRLSAVGKAAMIDIVQALLRAERENLKSVELPQSALTIYQAFRGKYVKPYVRTPCGECEETAELCPHCEGVALRLTDAQATCQSCSASLVQGEELALRCMNGHVTRVPIRQAFSIAPNHWFQKRLVQIFAEVGQSWNVESDYFYIEGSILYRLRRGQTDGGPLSLVVQNYLNRFWGPGAGPVQPEDHEALVSSLLPGAQQPTGSMDERRPGSGLWTYKDFDLRLRGSTEAGYTVEAMVSEGGSVPPQPLVFPNDGAFEQWLQSAVNQTATAHDVQALGEILFEALFPTRILKLWTRTLGSLEEDMGLRLKLHIAPPELMALPWELLFDEEYLGLRLRFPIVRYLDLPDPSKPLVVRLPLRVLVAISQPRDQLPFSAEAEVTNIRQALSRLKGLVKVQVVEHTTQDELLARLRHGYHILHYVGHGTFDGDEGFLILEDGEGRSDLAPALLLGQLVADSSLRLAVLNACETARIGSDGALSGVAHQLVRGGVPAVVAMQQVIADPLARAFTGGFYGALASGWPVDAAVQEGRRGIMSALGADWRRRIDWAIPTLYMRAPDGVILGIASKPPQPRSKQAGTAPDPLGQSPPVSSDPNEGAGRGGPNPTDSAQGRNGGELAELFEVLRQEIAEQTPPHRRKVVQQKVDALYKSLESGRPNPGKIESVVRWFRKNTPSLVGLIVSFVMNPVVRRVIEAADESAIEELQRRFGSTGQSPSP